MDKPTLLIVEDDGATFRPLSVLLGSFFDIVVSTSCARVPGLLDCHHPVVVILDLKLDDGNGSDLIPVIREKCPEAGIIILTGDITAYLAGSDFLDEHCIVVLTKPCFWDDLFGELKPYIPKEIIDAEADPGRQLQPNEYGESPGPCEKGA